MRASETFRSWLFETYLPRHVDDVAPFIHLLDFEEIATMIEGYRPYWKESVKMESQQELISEQLTHKFGALDRATLDRLTTASLDDLSIWARRLLDARTIDEVFG
ncbi:MAG: DUF4351 domain-containing protein [Acidobacteriota bacterium]